MPDNALPIPAFSSPTRCDEDATPSLQFCSAPVPQGRSSSLRDRFQIMAVSISIGLFNRPTSLFTAEITFSTDIIVIHFLSKSQSFHFQHGAQSTMLSRFSRSEEHTSELQSPLHL